MGRLSILLRIAGYLIYIATVAFFISSLIGMASIDPALLKDATERTDVRPPGDAFGFFHLQVLFRAIVDGPGLVGLALLLPTSVAMLYFGYVCISTATRIDRSEAAERHAAEELEAAIAVRKAGERDEDEE